MQMQIIFFFCCFFLTITNLMLWDQYNFLGGLCVVIVFQFEGHLCLKRESLVSFSCEPLTVHLVFSVPAPLMFISRTAAMSNICQWEKYILKEVIGLLLICKMLSKCLSKFTVFIVSSCVQDFKGTKMNDYLTSSLIGDHLWEKLDV